MGNEVELYRMDYVQGDWVETHLQTGTLEKMQEEASKLWAENEGNPDVTFYLEEA